MAITEAIPTSYDEAVRTLAEWHGGVRGANVEIYSFPDPTESVVRLVEVSDEFPYSGQIWPVTFGPSPEFPFQSTVVLLTPEEWQQVLAATLSLPEDWQVARRQKVWPDGAA